MNLPDVLDEVAAALATIPGLRVFNTLEKTVPPSAVVALPTVVEYDQTYARGTDRIDVGVVVKVGRTVDRASRDLLLDYLNGSGPSSVKEALEAHEPTSYDTLRVVRATPDFYTEGGVSYLACVFDLDIAGDGA